MWRERGEKRARSLHPEIIDPLLSPILNPPPLPGEELVTAQLWERDKYIYISRRICPSQLGCGAGQSLIVPWLACSRKAPQFGAGRAPALRELGTSWTLFPAGPYLFDWSHYGVGEVGEKGGSWVLLGIVGTSGENEPQLGLPLEGRGSGLGLGSVI